MNVHYSSLVFAQPCNGACIASYCPAGVGDGSSSSDSEDDDPPRRPTAPPRLSSQAAFKRRWNGEDRSVESVVAAQRMVAGRRQLPHTTQLALSGLQRSVHHTAITSKSGPVMSSATAGSGLILQLPRVLQQMLKIRLAEHLGLGDTDTEDTDTIQQEALGRIRWVFDRYHISGPGGTPSFTLDNLRPTKDFMSWSQANANKWIETVRTAVRIQCVFDVLWMCFECAL